MIEKSFYPSRQIPGELHIHLGRNLTPELIVMGRPDDIPGLDHSCDEMGCGSTGFHVLARLNLVSVSQFCGSAGFQQCHCCDDVNCGDYMGDKIVAADNRRSEP